MTGALLAAPIAADSSQWPVVDGRCHDRIYAGAGEGPISLAPGQLYFASSAYVLQGERELYVCLANLPRDGSDSAAVYFDRAHDAGTWADADDLQVVVGQPVQGMSMPAVTVWKGDGMGGYLQVNLPIGALRVGAANVDDLTWEMELSIDRGAVLGNGVDGRIGFAAQATRTGGEPCDCDHFWPDEGRWNRPATWGDLTLSPVPYAVVQSPVADTFADAGEPGTAEGSLTYLLANFGDRRIYLRFGPPPVPAGSYVQDLRLRLNAVDGGLPTPRQVQICPVTQSWTEAGLTWNNQPTVAANCFMGYDLEAFPTIATLGHGPWYTWPIAALARTRLDVASTWGLRLFLQGDGTEDRTHASREYAFDPYTWPELVWLYTPNTGTPTATSMSTYAPTWTPTASATWTTAPTISPTPSPTPSPTASASPTATPSPSATATTMPTPTGTPSGLQVSGRVVLERRSSNAGAQVCAGPTCVTTAADGRFQLAALPGSELRVRHPSYLAAWRTLAMTATSPVDLPPVTLLAGDLNQDGKVEVDDATMIGQRFDLRYNPADSRWLDACDITDDDVIDIRDMVGVQFNLLKTAPGPWRDAAAAR